MASTATLKKRARTVGILQHMDPGLNRAIADGTRQRRQTCVFAGSTKMEQCDLSRGGPL
jgi:hypothetical protein